MIAEGDAQALPGGTHEFWPVNRTVENVKNDGPDLIEHASLQESLL